ncbi:unnamed protein product [Caenorhabditis sp. 36 PRJEB53466]|nr:unnamed protein product [Caenorhabditis sp. 36 PRJEB53466]
MALASNGKRSFHNDHHYAAGDSLNNFSKVHRNSREENHLNVEMVERDSVVGNGNAERRFLGGLIGNKELGMMTVIAVALYLINGEYAQILSTAVTSVPPAVFSYRVLMNRKTSKDGYHSILFYWTLYGILTVIDQFVGTAQGYNLLKSGVLGAVFLHAVRLNPSSIPRSWMDDQATAEILSSIFSRYDSRGFIKKTDSSHFVPNSPTPTHFSDDETIYELSTSSDLEENAMDVSTAVSFLPSPSMQTTQKMSPDYVCKTATPQTMQVENEATEPPSTIRMRPKMQQQYETMSAMTMTVSGAPDIVTVPADRLVFSSDNRSAQIQVTNVSPLHIMFALKTNADTHLIAAPTTGVLLSGQSMTMRVGVTEKHFDESGDPGKSIDKLAIDYTSIPQRFSSSISSFFPRFFQSNNRRRHAIRVFYQ